jgi:NitT/TauT family transport system ATP-binding protein
MTSKDLKVADIPAAATGNQAQPANALEARGVSKTYHTPRGDTHSLATVDLSVPAGRFIAIVGASGCGKSTLLNILGGLLRPSSGEVFENGRPLTSPVDSVGMVFQEPALLPWKSVLHNTMIPGQIGGRKRHLPKAELEERARDLVKLVGLAGFEARLPNELSGGMQQRNAIARALVLDPPTLLMDEPFGALDALTRERMNVWLANVWQERQKAIVLVTHSISEAVFLADEVIVMSQRPGTIIERVPVPMPRPRTVESMEHPDFASLTVRIRAHLDAADEDITRTTFS